MPSACSGAAAPVPLLRCCFSGAAVASPSTTKLDPLRFVHALVAVLSSRFLAFSLVALRILGLQIVAFKGQPAQSARHHLSPPPSMAKPGY
ncbi:unnamed protein product [Ectocarpus sp. CCAP 1310/34]|nr:unnamed protein product [Ectocarpus sp. CCAP 1310/34]